MRHQGKEEIKETGREAIRAWWCLLDRGRARQEGPIDEKAHHIKGMRKRLKPTGDNPKSVDLKSSRANTSLV